MKNFYFQLSLFLCCLFAGTSLGTASSFVMGVDAPVKEKNKVETLAPKDKKEVGGRNDRPKKEDIPVNPSKSKRKNVAMTLPAVSAVKQDEVKELAMDLPLLANKAVQLLPTNLSTQKALGPDPFAFTTTTDKDSVSVGEEFELTVNVNWVDYGVNTGVRFLPEWYKYVLKVVMPKGFLQTGGDYTDYCTKPVDANNPQATFTIKGKFEYAPEVAMFTILRGFEGAGDLSGFVWKGERKVKLKGINNYFVKLSTSHNEKIVSQNDNCVSCKCRINGTSKSLISASPVSTMSSRISSQTICSPDNHWCIENYEVKTNATCTNFILSGNLKNNTSNPIYIYAIRYHTCGYCTDNNTNIDILDANISTVSIYFEISVPVSELNTCSNKHFDLLLANISDDTGCALISGIPSLKLASYTSVSNNVCPNVNFTLTAQGCTSYVWDGYSETGASLTTTISQSSTFKVKCGDDNIACWPQVSHTVSILSPPVANISGTLLPEISATGCPTGGTITWDDGINNHQNPRSIDANDTKTYKATCTLDGCTSGLSNGVKIVRSSTPNGISVPSNTFCKSSIDLTVSGCDETNKSRWYTQTGGAYNSTYTDIDQNVSYFSLPVSYNGNVKVYCLKSDGTTSATYFEKSINATAIQTIPKPTITLSPNPVNKDANVTITVGGCMDNTNPAWSSDNITFTAIPLGYTTTSFAASVTIYARCQYTSSVPGGSTICPSETVSKPLTITQPPTCASSTLALELVTTNTNCGSSTGQIVATGSGGIGTRYYKLGSTGTYSTTSTFTGLAVGSYTVWVKDANNCEKSVNATINANGGPDAPTEVAGGSRTGAGSVDLAAKCASGTITWYKSAVGGTAEGTTGSPFPTGYLSATTDYYVSCNETCTSGRVKATATIDAIIVDPCLGNPSAPSTTGDSRQGAGAVTVKANCTTAGSSARWYASTSSTTVLWSGGDYAIGNLEQTKTYYASCKTDACESGRASATATINPINNPCAGAAPPAPSPTNGSREGAGSVSIYASCYVSPTVSNIAKWYDKDGLLLATAKSNTDDQFITPSINNTTTFYAACVGSNGCESGRVGVLATILPACSTKPIAPATTSTSREAGGNLNIYANCNVSGQDWGNGTNIITRLYDGTNRLIGTSAQDQFTVSVNVTTTFYAACYNKTTNCESDRTAVVATVNPCATHEPSPTNGSRCGAGTVDLWAGCDNRNDGRWYSSEVGGSYIVQNLNDNNKLTVNVSSSRLYYASCFNTSNTCESKRVGVWAVVISPTISTTSDLEVCEGKPINLQVSNTETINFTGFAQPFTKVTTYEWTGPNSYISNAQNPTISTATMANAGVYTSKVFNLYTHLLLNGGANMCTATAMAQVTVYPTPATAPVLSASAVCQGKIGSISATNCGANSVLWYSSLTAPASLGDVNPFPVTIPVGDVSATYYAACSSKPELGCNSNRANVTITPTPAPVAPTNAKVNKPNTCIGSSVTLSATCPTGQTTVWYDASGVALNSLIITKQIPDTYKYYAACKAGTCETLPANRALVSVVVNNFPAAPVAASASATTICTGDPLTFNGTCATGQTLRWYSDMGGIITNIPGTYDYYLACQDNVSQCATPVASRVKTTVVVNLAAPVPVLRKQGDATAVTTNVYPTQPIYLTALGCEDCEVEWYEKVGGVFELMPYENIPILAVQKSLAGTYTYKAKFKRTTCTSGFSNEFSVVVAPCPALVIDQVSPAYVCEREAITLKVSTTQKGDGTSYAWFSQIPMEDNSGMLTVQTGGNKNEYYTTIEGQYYVKSCLASDGKYYGQSAPVQVKNLLVTATIDKLNVVLAEGTALNLTGSDLSPVQTGQTLAYSWTEPVVRTTPLTTASLSIASVTPANLGFYTFKINKTIGTKTCRSEISADVFVNAATCTIDFGDDPIYACENGRGKITVNTINTSIAKTVYYRIDGGEWQTSNEFSNLSDGTYKIEIMERATSLEYADANVCMAVSGSRTVIVECNLPQTDGTLACGDFKVEGLPSVVVGTPVILTARGCGSSNTIYWSNGASNQSSITVTPTEITTYSATCQFGNVSSGGSALFATSGVAQYCLSTQTVNVVAAGGPDDLPPLLPIPPCAACDNVSIEVTSPIGSTTPDFILVNTTTSSIGIGEVIYPIDLTKYSGTDLARAFYFAYLESEAKEGRTAFNKYAILTAKNCTGDVVWKKGTNTYKGNSLMVRPDAHKNGEYVMSCTKGTIPCEDKKVIISSYSYVEDCSGVTFSTNGPVKSGNNLVLSATGCSDGTVIWKKATFVSDLNPKIGIGLSITIPYPADASTYTANCYLKVGFGGKLCSKYITVAPNCPEFTVGYKDNNPKLIITSGCTSNVEWFNENGTSITTTRNNEVFDTFQPGPRSIFKLTAKCIATSCTKEIWILNGVAATVTDIDCRNKKIEVTGIPTGVCQNLEWQKVGQENTYTIANTSTTYRYNRDEDPTYGNYNIQISCKDENAQFKLYLQTAGGSTYPIKPFYEVVNTDFRNYKPDEVPILSTISRTKLYPDVNSTFILSSLCISGTTSWVVTGLPSTQYEISDSRNNKNGIIKFKNVDKDFTYTATCSTQRCPFTENVKINFCPGFTAYASPNEIAIGGSSMLFAKNCVGTVKWKNVTTNKDLPSVAGQKPIVKPSETTTYQATCFTTTGTHECISNEVTIKILPVKFNDLSYWANRQTSFFLSTLTDKFLCTGLAPIPDKWVDQSSDCAGIYEAKQIGGKAKVPAGTDISIVQLQECKGVLTVFDYSNGKKIDNLKSSYTIGTNPISFRAICITDDSFSEQYFEGPYTGVSDVPDTGGDNTCNTAGFGITFAPVQAIPSCGTFDIYSDGCKSNGKPKWIYNGKTIGTGNDLIGYQIKSRTNLRATIRFDCSNPACYDEVDVDIVGGPQSCRIAAPDGTTSTTPTATTNSTAAILACGEVSKADAMKGYITHLLGNILTGKTDLTLADAKAFLQLLVQVMCNDATLKASGVNIPCTLVIDDALAQKLVDKKYAEVATALTTIIAGNVPIADYNNILRPEYKPIYEALLAGLKMQLKESIEPYIAKLLKEIFTTTIIGKNAVGAYDINKVSVFITLLENVITNNTVLKNKGYTLTFTSTALTVLAQLYIDGKYDELAKKLAELMTQQIPASDDIKIIQPTYPDVLKAIIDQTKGFIAYNGKEYKTGDVIPVALASSVGAATNFIDLTAMFAPLKDVKTKLVWNNNATAKSDKTMATYKRNSTTSLAGDVVTVTNPYNNEVISVNVVVIEFKEFTLNKNIDKQIDPNTTGVIDEHEESYPTYNYDLVNSKPLIWKNIYKNIITTIPFKVTPSGAEKYINFIFDTSGLLYPNSYFSNNPVASNPSVFSATVQGSSIDIKSTLEMTEATIRAEISKEKVNTHLLNLVCYESTGGLDIKVYVIDEEDDDINEVKIKEGAKNKITIVRGVNGVLNTTPMGDDNIMNGEIEIGVNGILETLPTGDDKILNGEIGGGANGVLETTPSGDDIISSGKVTSGINGILETTPTGDDKIINGKIGFGVDGILNSTILGDDKLKNGEISTGLNGICNTNPVGDDQQPTIKFGKGAPNERGVTWGNNKFRDTKEISPNKGGGDDLLVIDPITGEEYFDTGADGICQTTADNSPTLNNSWRNLNISDSEILNKVNEIYGQAGYSFSSVSIEYKSVNYDKNRDGLLEKTKLVAKSDETVLLFKGFGITNETTVPVVGISIPTIIVVDDFSEPTKELNGSATQFGTKLILLRSKIIQPRSFLLLTFPHEIGHAYFSLDHPFTDNLVDHSGLSNYSKKQAGNSGATSNSMPDQNFDQYNIMDYEIPNLTTPIRSKIRKYQWSLVHKNK